MIGLLSALVLLSALPVEITVAPDQPMAYVYVDEPLVLEFIASEDLKVPVELDVNGPVSTEPIHQSLGSLDLRKGVPYWQAVHTLPYALGNYTITLRLGTEADADTRSLAFCRITRAGGELPLPIHAHGGLESEKALLAIRGIPLPAIRVDLGDPAQRDRIDDLVSRGFQIVAYLDITRTPEAVEYLKELASLGCRRVARWELYAGEHPGGLAAAVETIRDAECAAPAAVVVDSQEQFAQLLDEGAGSLVRAVVLRSNKTPAKEALHALQDTAEAAGFEAWGTYLDTPYIDGTSITGLEAAQACVRALAAGAAGVGVPSAQIYNEGLTTTFGYLNGLARRFAVTQAAGPLNLAKNAEAYLFRKGAHWLLIAWGTGDGDITLPVPAADATDLELTDMLGNNLTLPAMRDGNLPVVCGKQPVMLTGTGGPILAAAARTQARESAEQLLQTSFFQRNVSPTLTTLVREIARKGGELPKRDDFFVLVRSFPALEQQWHAGKLPRPMAVPAIAGLARLVRQICTVEEAGGTPFIEPITDTLARSQDYQSQYLTSSVGEETAYERGDWLLNEVRHLMDEAQSLRDEGRTIEAAAVATLAEWRARGLEFAAQAGPLSDTLVVAELPVAIVGPDPVHTPETPSVAPASEEVTPVVPMPGETATPKDEAQELKPVAPAADVSKTHTVARGENASIIANKYKISTDALLAANKLTKRATLQIGQALVIPGAEATPEETPKATTKEEPAPEAKVEAEAAPEPEVKPEQTAVKTQAATTPRDHVVVRGDNPYEIAKKYGMDLQEFMRLNKLTKNSTLRIGQRLIVQPGATAAAPASPSAEKSDQKEITHTVRAGDNPSVIANKYGVELDDFLKWNNLTRRSMLHIGDKYTIYTDR